MKQHENDTLILEHYREQAGKDGDSPSSTMSDKLIRQKELDLITSFVRSVKGQRCDQQDWHVLDAGCGNGYTLKELVNTFEDIQFAGLEITPELLEIAEGRQLSRCQLQGGDIRHAPHEDGSFDIIFTERCLINILDPAEQQEALREIARMLKPSGYYLMIECFTDGLENNNRARREMGLEVIAPAYHNLYFDKEELVVGISDVLVPVDPQAVDPNGGAALFPGNFLSSHYFVQRVLHPLVSKGDCVRNTEFVNFFSFLPPLGNYSPLQSLVFKKAAGTSIPW